MQAKRNNRLLIATLAAVGVLGGATMLFAHGGGRRGRQMCGGPGMGAGDHGGDMRQIHALFAHRDRVRRTVTTIPGGVRATTESDDPAVVALLRDHVRAMYARLKEGRPIHAGDPLFAALFANAEKIVVVMDDTPHGITVTETSADPEVVGLVRRHAEVVSLFLENGMHEMMRNHSSDGAGTSQRQPGPP
jgi:hypothetical protein